MSRVFQALGIATATLDLGIAGKIALWYDIRYLIPIAVRKEAVYRERWEARTQGRLSKNDTARTFSNFLRLIFYNYIMWFNRNRRKKVFL